MSENITMHQKYEKFDIHIASDGKWFHQGGEIKRQAMVKLFASILSQDEKGRYWLTTPIEKGEVTVEDAPFIITNLTVLSPTDKMHSRLVMRDNVDRKFELGGHHSIFFKNADNQKAKNNSSTPYLRLNDGLTAKISRPVYYQLMDMVTEDSHGNMGVWSGEEFVILR